MTSLLLARLVLLVDGTPKPEDVKAGWTAFAVFLLLIVAVALLGISLTRHLRKAQANEAAGLFGTDRPSEPVGADGPDGAGGPDGPAAAGSEPHQAP